MLCGHELEKFFHHCGTKTPVPGIMMMDSMMIGPGPGFPTPRDSGSLSATVQVGLGMTVRRTSRYCHAG
eukprot:2339376-Rhodomonas_salina.3